MTAVQCSESSGNVHIYHQGRGECDFSNFDRDMIFGAKQADLSISIIADLLDFSCTTVSSV